MNDKCLSPMNLWSERYSSNPITKNEFGKMMGDIFEQAIKEIIKNNCGNIIIPPLGSEDLRLALIPEIKIDVSNQLKFRQIDTNKKGQISPSKGLYLEVTRRSNGKNTISASSTGHPTYLVSEQDYFIIALDVNSALYNAMKNLTKDGYMHYYTTGYINDKHFLDYLDIFFVLSLDISDPNNVDYVVKRITKKIWDNKHLKLSSGLNFQEKVKNVIEDIKHCEVKKLYRKYMIK